MILVGRTTIYGSVQNEIRSGARITLLAAVGRSEASPSVRGLACIIMDDGVISLASAVPTAAVIVWFALLPTATDVRVPDCMDGTGRTEPGTGDVGVPDGVVDSELRRCPGAGTQAISIDCSKLCVTAD
jgi:hypothetical protein